MRILFFALLSFLFFGCVSMQAFTAEDIKNPCSVVTAKEMAQVCGYPDLSAVELSIPITSKCEYFETANSTNPLISIAYMPDSFLSYDEYKRNLESFSSETSPSLKIKIEKENLGIGDKSILARAYDTEKNTTIGYYLSIFKGSSQIDIFNPKLNESDKCFDQNKTIKVGQLALSKLSKR